MARQCDFQGFTHAALCEIAVKWLRRAPSAGGPGCLVAVSEVAGGYTGEIPDAIGFSLSVPSTGSTVVEVKVTRSDFLADRKKPHRQSGGMGVWRYYMAPEGLIATDELPVGWGLIEVSRRGHCKVLAGGMANAKTIGYGDLLDQAERWRHSGHDSDREQWLLVRLLSRLGDVEALNQQRREEFRERSRLIDRVNSMTDEINELRRDIRWQTRADRLASLEISRNPASAHPVAV